MIEKKYLTWAMLITFALLYFVWPLVHTIALRKMLLLIAATIGAVLLIKSLDRKVILNTPWMRYAGLLLAWVVFHAAFLSQNGGEAWKELFGQWDTAYMALLAGIACALASRRISPRVFKVYLWTMLAAPPIFYMLLTLIKSAQIGHLAIGYWGMSDHKMSLEFYANILAAASSGMLIVEARAGKPISSTLLWLLPNGLAIYVAILSESRNGLFLAVGCLLLALIMIIYQARKKIHNFAFVAMAMLLIFSIYGLLASSSLENKWLQLSSDVRVSVNIDKYLNWTSFYKLGIPNNELGKQIEESAYLRIAYATAGVRAVIEYPWGYGVTRKAFERLIQKKYPEASIANSHNAYIDLVCAVGFPALLLLILMVFSVIIQVKRTQSEWSGPAIWVIGLVMVHWMIDPLSRDHYFETFLFLIGLFSILTIENDADNTKLILKSSYE